MKIKYSLFSRRNFLNSLFGGGILAFLSSFIYPIVKFIFPPSREPDKIVLKYEYFKDMIPYTVRVFAFGSKPGILVKKENYYKAFIAICTHLDCTVTFLPEKDVLLCLS